MKYQRITGKTKPTKKIKYIPKISKKTIKIYAIEQKERQNKLYNIQEYKIGGDGDKLKKDINRSRGVHLYIVNRDRANKDTDKKDDDDVDVLQDNLDTLAFKIGNKFEKQKTITRIDEQSNNIKEYDIYKMVLDGQDLNLKDQKNFEDFNNIMTEMYNKNSNIITSKKGKQNILNWFDESSANNFYSPDRQTNIIDSKPIYWYDWKNKVNDEPFVEFFLPIISEAYRVVKFGNADQDIIKQSVNVINCGKTIDEYNSLVHLLINYMNGTAKFSGSKSYNNFLNIESKYKTKPSQKYDEKDLKDKLGEMTYDNIENIFNIINENEFFTNLKESIKKNYPESNKYIFSNSVNGKIFTATIIKNILNDTSDPISLNRFLLAFKSNPYYNKTEYNARRSEINKYQKQKQFDEQITQFDENKEQIIKIIDDLRDNLQSESDTTKKKEIQDNIIQKEMGRIVNDSSKDRFKTNYELNQLIFKIDKFDFYLENIEKELDKNKKIKDLKQLRDNVNKYFHLEKKIDMNEIWKKGNKLNKKKELYNEFLRDVETINTDIKNNQKIQTETEKKNTIKKQSYLDKMTKKTTPKKAPANNATHSSTTPSSATPSSAIPVNTQDGGGSKNNTKIKKDKKRKTVILMKQPSEIKYKHSQLKNENKLGDFILFNENLPNELKEQIEEKLLKFRDLTLYSGSLESILELNFFIESNNIS